MSETLFKKVDYSLSKLLQDIELGEIGLPDIQRPFVWKPVQVRDLFDSMYKGFPVGYLLFWATESNGARQIGVVEKQKAPRLLIVDGQQRLTSLYAVLRGVPVTTSDYKPSRIYIAFRPRDEKFEVADSAIQRDPEFIPDISALWEKGISSYTFIKGFLTKLRQSHEIGSEEEGLISEKIDRLYDLQNYPFTVMEIASTISEEQVADIFVRINSKGVQLNQADFILTLLSVFWDKGRADLENFSRSSKQPSGQGQPSPYNHLIKPKPDQMLRAAIAFGFRRARLQHVYSILRGKDLETEQFSQERRIAQFEILESAQKRALDLDNWHEFLKAVMQAGFLSNSMVSSEVALLYAYAFYLIGKYEYKVQHGVLRNIMARWFFMATLSSRYTGSPESSMDQDLARLRTVSDATGFVTTLERTIESVLTNDFWEVTVPNQLETSSVQSPALSAYHAALSLLDAKVLFSSLKVSALLDPALVSHRKSVERHHLFPKAYLKRLGYEEVRIINQVANYAWVEWADNTSIADQSPADYFPNYAARFPEETLSRMMEWHALPPNWYDMDYETFLEQRRVLMARITRRGFETIARP